MLEGANIASFDLVATLGRGGSKSSVSSYVYILALLTLMFWAAIPQVVGADWPDCNFVCTANDFNVLDVYLGDSSGNKLEHFDPGCLVTAYIWVTFENNANTARYAVILLANVTIDGVLEESFWNYTGHPHDGLCVIDSIAGKTSVKMDIYNFTRTCEDEVKLENMVLTWDVNNESCSDYTSNDDIKCAARGTSKCYKETEIIVRGPLVANFTFTNVCFCANTTFTDTTTGGNRSAPYTYHWDFGDGNSSSEKNPSYHYPSAGNYTVNLTVTDVDGRNDSKTREVAVFSNPTANIVPDPAKTCEGVNLQLNGTPLGGTPPYTHNWTGDGAAYLSATNIANPVFNSSVGGTYNLTYTVNDSNGCEGTDDIQVTVYNSSLLITKTANTTGPVSPGDVIKYTITVCNTGNPTLEDVKVFDNRTGTHNVGTLNVSECNETNQTYTVTEQDLCNGSVTNYAYATATDYCDLPVVTETNASVRLDVDYNSSISIDKVANVSGSVSPGDVVKYTITVCNTGNLTLDDVTVFDNRTGTYDVGTLAKGECNETNQTYTVTEQDLCNGSVTNYAYATATDYCDLPVVTETNASVRLDVDYNSSISIDKVANVSGSVSPGDVVKYTITVCNTGNLTLDDVTVFDNRTGTYDVGTLAKGECNETNQTYTVTEQDLCRPIVNAVKVNATDLCGKEVEDNDSNTVSTVCSYCISGHKYWDKDGDDVGDSPLKNWTILVRNDTGFLGESKTEDEGYWEVCNLTPGTYNVSEVVKDGWKPTNPASGYYDSVNVTSDNVTDINFVNIGIFCISGHKYWDKDGDGIKDPEDEPLANWIIFIDQDGDRTADPHEPVTTTGSGGFWEICNLQNGTYVVCEAVRTGWNQTYPRGTGCYTVKILDENVTDLDFLNAYVFGEFGARSENMNLDTINVSQQDALSLGLNAFATNSFEVDKEQNAGELRSEDICVCRNTVGLLNLDNRVVNVELINSEGQSAIAGDNNTAINNVAIKVRQC